MAEEKTGGRCGAAFNVFPGCRDCLVGLADTAADLSAGEDKLLAEQARTEARAVIREVESGPEADLITSPELANRMLRALRSVTGRDDPYLDIKKKEMARAAEAFRRAEDRARRDLRSAVICAGLGNSLDFFRPAEEAIPSIAAVMEKGFSWQRDDLPSLSAFLETRPQTVVYLTDNAGEVYFDLPLYDYLAAKAERVVLTVKGGPALNDLTAADLRRSGLFGRFQEVKDTGAAGAGVDWPHVSAEFTELLETADLVVSKGMANFETLYPKPIPPPVFFLFKVKCRPMKDFLDAEPETFWALWREGRGG